MNAVKPNKRESISDSSFLGFKQPSFLPQAAEGMSFYERIYRQKLDAMSHSAMNFNIVRYLECLIVLDQQNREWINSQTDGKSCHGQSSLSTANN
jgi:hypothetical protein